MVLCHKSQLTFYSTRNSLHSCLIRVGFSVACRKEPPGYSCAPSSRVAFMMYRTHSTLFLTTSPTTALQHALSLGHHQWDVLQYPQLATWAPIQVSAVKNSPVSLLNNHMSLSKFTQRNFCFVLFLQSTKNNLTLPWDMSVSQVPLP